MTESDGAHDHSQPINPDQAAMIIDQLRDLAHVVYLRPPQDVDFGVSYENGSSYYRVEIRWNAPAGTNPEQINDVDTLLQKLFNEERGNG